MSISKWILNQQYGQGLIKSMRDAVFKRRYKDGYNLSDRIWNMATISEREILGRVNTAISNGISAVELSKSVRQFLLQPGPSWTTGIKPSVTGRGSIAYNALRLARTEINGAYKTAQTLQAQNSPLVVGTKWNLSGSHPTDWPLSAAYMGYPEICDYFAQHDHHGLGPGVFPKDDVWETHPNCLCYLTDVLAPPEQIEQLLVANMEMELGIRTAEQVKELNRKIASEVARSGNVTQAISTGPSKQDLSEFARIYNKWDGVNVKTFATDIVNKEGLPLKVQRHRIDSNGQCRLDSRSSHLKILSYELNSQDSRSKSYQVKTTFHELYHAKAHGLLHDIDVIGLKDWAYVDDVFAEVTAHYMAQSVGITDEIAPAYASHLIDVLPKLKKTVSDFASCNTIVDFGEVAYKYRFSGDATAQWKTFTDTLKQSTFDIIEYSKDYLYYIDKHKEELVDKLLENMPRYEQYRSYMVNDVKQAIIGISSGKSLSDNEQLVFENALIITMNRLGVK